MPADRAGIAQQVAELARSAGRWVATAESLTCGGVATALGAAPGAASWFRGGLVSYHDEVKHEVLSVADGPVVSAEAARQMAVGVARLLRADVAVATTGSGGPEEQDDRPPGTAFVAVLVDDGVTRREFHFDGDPEQVVAQSTDAALSVLLAAMGPGGGAT